MKSDIVHIHIPKTGGTWLKHVLNTYVPDHLIFSGHGSIDYSVRTEWQLPVRCVTDGIRASIKMQTKEDIPQFPEKYARALKISSVRNPFAMLASIYFHVNGGMRYKRRFEPSAETPEGWDQINVIHGFRSFEEFISRFCEPEYPFFHDRYREHLFYQLFDKSGRCGIDLVMRCELQNRAIAGWLQSEGYVTLQQRDEIVELPNQNIGIGKRDYRSFYTAEMREMVEKHCASELELFGYDFDGPTNDDFFLNPLELRKD